jgi:hypothetical protein
VVEEEDIANYLQTEERGEMVEAEQVEGQVGERGEQLGQQILVAGGEEEVLRGERGERGEQG